MARARDLEALGAEYRVKHNGFLPDRVRRSGRKERRKAMQALGDGCGWLARLAMAGDNLRFFTVSLDAFNLEHLQNESSLYDHDAINSIRQATLEATPGAFWARLEVGKYERKLHVHILAHDAPRVAYASRKVESLERVAAYVSKCPVPGGDQSAGIFLEAQKRARESGRKRLPRTSFRRGIPNS